MFESFTPLVIFLWLGVFLPLLVGLIWVGWSIFRPRVPIVLAPEPVFETAKPVAVGPKPLTAEEQLERVRRIIAAKDADDEEAPRRLVFSTYVFCTPRHPELAAEVHAAIARHEGTEWRIAAFELDLHIIERFELYGELDLFDFAGALERLRQGLISHDRHLSDYAGQYAADLMVSGYLIDAHSRWVFNDALTWASNLHWPRLEGHVRLLDAIEAANGRQAVP